MTLKKANERYIAFRERLVNQMEMGWTLEDIQSSLIAAEELAKHGDICMTLYLSLLFLDTSKRWYDPVRAQKYLDEAIQRRKEIIR